METYVMEIIKRATVFMILAQAVIHFRPNPSYEKYFKFLAGIMTIVILIIPVVEVVRGGVGREYEACIAGYADRLQEISTQEITVDMTPSQSYLYTMGKEISDRLNDTVILEGYYAESADITGIPEEGDGQGEDGYRIRVCFLPIHTEASAIKVEPVCLQEEREDVMAGGENREHEVQRKVAQVLGVDESRVEVEIRE